MPKIEIDRERCKGCKLCMVYCPKGCIKLEDSINKRGVYPVLFDVTDPDPDGLYNSIFTRLLDLGQAEEGDLLIFTKGDMRGVTGGTNAMTVLRLTSQ